jgi:type IV secretory pathway VirB2 component (pilin)
MSFKEIFAVIFVIVLGGMWLSSTVERKLRERDLRRRFGRVA